MCFQNDQKFCLSSISWDQEVHFHPECLRRQSLRQTRRPKKPFTMRKRSKGLQYAKLEEVRQGLNYALRHALACTINCVLLAITHAYKCSWQLKSRFSRYFAGGSEGLSHSKGLLFEGKNHGPKDRAKLQEYIGKPLARTTVDAFNDGKKY